MYGVLVKLTLPYTKYRHVVTTNYTRRCTAKTLQREKVVEAIKFLKSDGSVDPSPYSEDTAVSNHSP